MIGAGDALLSIKDEKKIKEYIKSNNMDKIFTKDVLGVAELLCFKKYEFICQEGEPLKYILFFVEGRAKVFTTLKNGKSLLLCFYDSFKVLGDLEFLNYKNAATNVQAIMDSFCIGIPLEKARAVLMQDANFLRFLCESLGEKLNRCSRNSSINLLYPLENRLASYVVAAGERDVMIHLGRICFFENLTELSELLGTSYRHLLRTLEAMIEKRILMREMGSFTVIDEERLLALAADIYR
jgi:CRP/FNR family putative post-exponential-phase nitrogen-starvation transcriptional regulator